MEATSSTEDADFYRKLFFPSASILLVLATVGVYGHANIIIATIRFKILHTPCCFLIAVLALGDLVHQLAQFPYAVLIFTGNTFIPHRTCFWIQMFPAVFMLHSIVMILVLGLDRLFCVTLPLIYRKNQASPTFCAMYLTIVNLIPTTYALYIGYLSYFSMLENSEKATLCLIVGFFSGEALELWANTTVLFSALSVLLYIVIWIVVWKKTNVSSSTKSSVKPLTVMLCLTIFGWFTGMSLVAVIGRLSIPENLQIGLSSYAGISINASVMANYFVYKRFGTDYRRAFKELWSKQPVSDITTTGSKIASSSRTSQK